MPPKLPLQGRGPNGPGGWTTDLASLRRRDLNEDSLRQRRAGRSKADEQHWHPLRARAANRHRAECPAPLYDRTWRLAIDIGRRSYRAVAAELTGQPELPVRDWRRAPRLLGSGAVAPALSARSGLSPSPPARTDRWMAGLGGGCVRTRGAIPGMQSRSCDESFDAPAASGLNQSCAQMIIRFVFTTNLEEAKAPPPATLRGRRCAESGRARY